MHEPLGIYIYGIIFFFHQPQNVVSYMTVFVIHIISDVFSFFSLSYESMIGCKVPNLSSSKEDYDK